MTTDRLSRVVALSTLLAAGCAALVAARLLLPGEIHQGSQPPLLGHMVDSSVVQLEVALQEHREVTYLLQRMH